MIKLKYIKLINFCGYRNFELDLTDGNDIKKWQILYGPNGIGKSNLIRAIDFLSSPKKYIGRSDALILRKLKYNKEYIAGTEALLDKVEDLYMEAVYIREDNEEKKVIIEDRIQGQLTSSNRNNAENISGVTLNELPQDVTSASLFIDADHPINMNRFQLDISFKIPFINFAESVYGYKCFLPENSIVKEEGCEVYKDFILEKKSPGSDSATKVHFKRFSDGEKKIVTLLVSLFENAYKKETDNNSIILIDNIEQHIYFKRHMLLIKKINEFFPKHQIIASTHSSIIINEMDKKYLYDLEECIK